MLNTIVTDAITRRFKTWCDKNPNDKDRLLAIESDIEINRFKINDSTGNVTVINNGERLPHFAIAVMFWSRGAGGFEISEEKFNQLKNIYLKKDKMDKFETEGLVWEIDAKRKTISPPNPYNDRKRSESEILKSIEFEENKQRFKIIASECKSGIILNSEHLAYTDKDMRPFRLNDNNEATVLTK